MGDKFDISMLELPNQCVEEAGIVAFFGEWHDHQVGTEGDAGAIQFALHEDAEGVEGHDFWGLSQKAKFDQGGDIGYEMRKGHGEASYAFDFMPLDCSDQYAKHRW